MDSKRVGALRPARAGVIASSLALLAMLISSNAAIAADIPLGAPAGDVPNSFCTFTNPGMDAIQVSTDPTTSTYAVTQTGGSITSWNTTIVAGMTGLVGLEVWHLVTPADPVTPAVYRLVGASPLVIPDPTNMPMRLSKPIAVSPGDVLGMRADGVVACGTKTASALDFYIQATSATTLTPESFPYTSAGRLNITATWSSGAPPPPPPPPPSTGCDTTGTSQGNDVCTQK